MGGKGGGGPSPPPIDTTEHDLAMREMEEMMMSMMGGVGTSVPGPPPTPPMPEVIKAPEIDWTEKHEQLSQKVKADVKGEMSKKKGVPSTILTSPFLDEEAATTTKSPIVGT